MATPFRLDVQVGSSRSAGGRVTALSRLVLACLVLACLVLSCLALSFVVLYCLVLSCPTMSCLALPSQQSQHEISHPMANILMHFLCGA